MTRPWLLVLLFFRLELLVGWVTLSQSRFGAQLADIQKQTAGNLQNVSVPLIQRLGFFWSAPQVQSSASGLGGGITWAWDSTLCSKLLPLFHETVFGYQLVTCETIKAAVHRGFASWADNHPTISISRDERVQALGMLSPSCPLAELWVTALNATSSGSKSAALTDTQLAALMAVPTDQQSAAATGNSSPPLAWCPKLEPRRVNLRGRQRPPRRARATRVNSTSPLAVWQPVARGSR